MNSQSHIFSSESVTEGHPDKVADQISDAVLDALLAEDPQSRVACETLVTTGMAVLSGEITTQARINYAEVVRQTIKEIGYTNSAIGFDCTTCAVLTSLDTQSPDIAMGVDTGGAGDQGMMFGYACTETDELMPMPITLAHNLTRRLSEVRRSNELPWLRPDGKAQVSIQYDGGKPIAIRAVVVSTQHDEEIELADLQEAIRSTVVDPVLANSGLDTTDANYFINPTGRFVVGGPQGDAGLTGRKIIVDTYGGFARHGGGAFSGKDPSKVDRSATYAARWVAKNVVAAGLATHCEVQFAYAIGVAEPVSVMIDTFGTGVAPDSIIEQAVRAVFELNPAGIIRALNLKSPMFKPTAAFGHFGQPARSIEVNGKTVDLFTWEATGAASDMQAAVEAASATAGS